MNKDQAEMLNRFRKSQIMYFLISMGVGKTRGSLICVKWLHEFITKHAFSFSIPKGLIVCHTADSRDKTWPKEITDSNEWLIPLIKAGTVKLVHRDHVLSLPPDHYAWIIWDECHLIKEEHFAFFDKNKYSGLILMSGTKHDDPNLQKRILKLVNNNVMEIPVEKAIEDKIINDYRVKIITVPLYEEEKRQYASIGQGLTKSMFVSSDFRQMMIGKRMKFIYELESKFDALKRICDLSTRRKMIFLNRKEMCPAISSNIYHSGTKDAALTAFAAGTIDDLVSIKQLRTGSNFKNFDTIFSQQVNSKSSTFMQDLGRLFRLDIGQIGTIYAFCAENTQDVSWIDKALVHIPSHKKRFYDWDHTMPIQKVQEILDDSF
jgi:superfamily II DNA or RNA helicase